jgi:hypothetical protein
MRHEMPAGLPDEGQVPPEACREWQTAHEPLLVLKAWLGTDDRAMVRIEWASDVQEASQEDMPLDDMLQAVVHIAHNLENITKAVITMQSVRSALEAVQGDN